MPYYILPHYEDYKLSKNSHMLSSVYQLPTPAGTTLQEQWPSPPPNNNIALIRFLLACRNNYAKTATTLTTTLDWYTRDADETYIQRRIDTHLDNAISLIFINKTSLSGLGATRIVERIGDNYTVRELTNVSIFLTKPRITTRCYEIQNKMTDKKSILLLGGSISFGDVYTMIGMIPQWFPHLFESLNDTQKAAIINYCKAIGRKNENETIAAVETLISLIQEKTPEIDYKALLKALDNKTQRENKLKADARSYRANITTFLEEYTKNLRNLEIVNKQLETLYSNQSDAEKDIDELQNFKSLTEYNDSAQTITITSKVIPSDVPLAEKIFSDSYKASMYHCTTAKMRQLLLDVLVNFKYRINFIDTFVLPNLTRVTNTRTTLTKNSMPNPHLAHHNCFGSNARVLATALTSGDVISTLGALTACNSCLNIGDPVVLKEFVKDIIEKYGTKPILYHYEHKKYYTPQEVLANETL